MLISLACTPARGHTQLVTSHFPTFPSSVLWGVTLNLGMGGGFQISGRAMRDVRATTLFLLAPISWVALMLYHGYYHHSVPLDFVALTGVAGAITGGLCAFGIATTIDSDRQSEIEFIRAQKRNVQE